ncbi:MAG: TonB-dependent receptor [Pseudomonadota bacterium]
MKRHIIVAASLCAGLPAFAEPLQPDVRLDPIVVSASKRAQPLAETPASVNLVAMDDIAAGTALNDAGDIVELVPGVQAAVANGTQVAFQIRGIGAVDHQALTPGAAAVYVDGVLLATNVQTGGLLFDLDRIEVLKGPQGTLYGRNSSSGVISFQTVRPGEDQSRFAEASLGRFDRVDVRAAGGTTLADGIHLRLAGRALRQTSALENVQTSQAVAKGPESAGGETDRFGLRAGLLVEDIAGGELLLRGHYEEDNGTNASPRNSALQVDDFEISIGGDGVQDTDNEFYGISAAWEGEFAEWKLVSLTAIEGYNQQYGFDFDGSPAPFGNDSLNANLSYDRDYLQLSQDLSLQTEAEWGRMLFGASASYDDFSQVYTIWCGELDPATLLGTCRYVGAPGRVGPNPASGGVATTLVTEIDQDRTSLGLFARGDIDLSPRVSLIGGLRLDHETIEGSGQGEHIFDDGTVAFNNRDGAGPAIGGNEIEDTFWSGNVGLNYQFGSGLAYASITQGYKSGGFNGEVANNALHYADEGLFGAETVTAYELGYRSRPTNTLHWSVAAFFQDYDAPQARIFVNFPLPDGSTIVSNSLSNLDAATIYGVETALNWHPVDQFSLAAGLTLLDTEIDQVSDLGGNADLFDGNPLPFASDISATLSARYDWQVSAGLTGGLRIGAKYRSDFFLDAEGLSEREQAGYTTLSADASLRFEERGIEVSVFGRNLLNEDYAVSGFGFIGYNTFRSEPALWGIRARLDY